MYSTSGLFGGSANGKIAENHGLMSHLINKVQQSFPYRIDRESKGSSLVTNEEIVRRLLVLDGLANSNWVENLNSVLDIQKSYTVSSSEKIKIGKNLKFVFSTPHLHFVTPATLGRIVCIHVPGEFCTWKEFLREEFLGYYTKDSSFACADLM